MSSNWLTELFIAIGNLNCETLLKWLIMYSLCGFEFKKLDLFALLEQCPSNERIEVKNEGKKTLKS